MAVEAAPSDPGGEAAPRGRSSALRTDRHIVVGVLRVLRVLHEHEQGGVELQNLLSEIYELIAGGEVDDRFKAPAEATSA